MKKKKKRVDVKRLRIGDIVFTKDIFPFGWITMLVTRGRETHCGIVVKKDDKLCIAEMVSDNNKNTNDVEFNPFSKYYKARNGKIVSIKRSHIFDGCLKRILLNDTLLKLKATYDFEELFSFITHRQDKHPERLICSGMVYIVTKACGVVWRTINKDFAPSPAELAKDNSIREVRNWKIK